MEKVLVDDIQGYSIHDGPGIRTTVFLKGCNLRCDWCQNPEGIAHHRQIGFIEHLCQQCGKCLAACPEDAIQVKPGEHRIDYSKCTACGKCLETCYYGALVDYGKPMSAEELAKEAAKDELFFGASGGGVTISGGEPLLHPDFVAEVLRILKDRGIHTAIETAGCVPWDSFEKVLPYTDLFLFDLKIMDPEKHKYYIGQSNELILSNAEKLIQAGAEVLFRKPLIPGINDSDEETLACAKFMKRIGNPKLQLMPYHRMGESKYNALDKPYSTKEVPVMTREEVELVRSSYEVMGIDCTISG